MLWWHSGGWQKGGDLIVLSFCNVYCWRWEWVFLKCWCGLWRPNCGLWVWKVGIRCAIGFIGGRGGGWVLGIGIVWNYGRVVGCCWRKVLEGVGAIQ